MNEIVKNQTEAFDRNCYEFICIETTLTNAILEHLPSFHLLNARQFALTQKFAKIILV